MMLVLLIALFAVWLAFLLARHNADELGPRRQLRGRTRWPRPYWRGEERGWG